MAVEEVLTRDLSSGKIHKKFRDDGGPLFSLEADNQDEAGDFEEIDRSALTDADPEDFCKRCFPKGD